MSSALLQSSSDDISSDNVVRKTDSWRDIYKSQEFAQFAPKTHKTDNRLYTSSSTTTFAPSSTSGLSSNETSNHSTSIVQHMNNWRTTEGSIDIPNAVTNHQSRSESITRKNKYTLEDISTNDVLNVTFPAQSLESEWNTSFAEQAMILAKFEQESKRTKTSASTVSIQTSTIKRSKSLASATPMLMENSEVDHLYITNENLAAILNEGNKFTEEVSKEWILLLYL
jgi:hypothetical protein